MTSGSDSMGEFFNGGKMKRRRATFSVCDKGKRSIMGLFPMVLLLLFGGEEMFDLADEAIPLLLEATLPGERVTRTRSGRGRRRSKEMRLLGCCWRRGELGWGRRCRRKSGSLILDRGSRRLLSGLFCLDDIGSSSVGLFDFHRSRFLFFLLDWKSFRRSRLGRGFPWGVDWESVG